MTQPAFRPAQPPASDPFDKPWDTRWAHCKLVPVVPELQTALRRHDPFDQLANQLTDLGLHVRREVFVNGTTWPIVANNPYSPYEEVRVKLGAHLGSVQRGSLLVLEVRPDALWKDCELAATIAAEFTWTVRRDATSK